MKTFAQALKEQIESRKQTRRGKRLLDIIASPNSNRKKRILDRLENHAIQYLQDEGLNVTDWEQVGERDWAGFFEGLLKFLLAILPAILPLFMGKK